MNNNKTTILFPRVKDGNNNIIFASKAKRSESYFCEYCGCPMDFKTSKLNTPFFAKKKGAEHKHKICIQIEKSKKYYSFSASESPLDLITSLYYVSPRAGGGGNPGGPHPGTYFPLEDDSETEITAVPFKTLKQIYEYGLFEDNPNEKIGEYSISDFYIHYRWAPFLLSNRYSNLGARIIHAKYHHYDDKTNDLYFWIFKSQEFKRFFKVHFLDRSLYQKTKKKVQKYYNPEGKNREVLIAYHDWEYISCGDYYYAQIFNSKQLYVISPTKKLS